MKVQNTFTFSCLKVARNDCAFVAGITTVQLVPINPADAKHDYPPSTAGSSGMHVSASTVKAYMQQFRDRKLTSFRSHGYWI